MCGLEERVIAKLGKYQVASWVKWLFRELPLIVCLVKMTKQCSSTSL